MMMLKAIGYVLTMVVCDVKKTMRDSRFNPDRVYHIIMKHVIIQRITDDFF
jgi:hypothetical protein